MRQALLFIIFSLAWTNAALFAQIKLVRFDSVEVVKDQSTLENPWAGGLNSPQFSELDLNGDGLKDLVAFERNFFGVVKTFLNLGGQKGYVHAPEYQDNFPAMRNWMLLRDYNCDGKEDIFTAVPAGVAVYRNDSGPGPGLKFTLVTGLLTTFGLDGPAPLYVSPPDIPAIEDIDGDGDLDILTFNVIGSTMEYHKNLSMENNGDCNELVFELRNACWGYFSEDGNNNTVSLFDTCEVNVSDPEKSGRHAGSTILAIDLDGDGVKDLLLGDITYNNLVRLNNGGTLTSAIMTSQQTDFPADDIPVDLTVFPASYHLDVNNDGLKDLLVAPNNPNTSENINNIWYYQNTGTPSVPKFEFQQDDFIQGGMIDLGERSFPAFFDENGDGLTDIIAGSFGYFLNAGDYASRLVLLRNSGTPSHPSFTVITDDYAGLGEFGFNGIYPAFGDLDQDGDRDMITGDEEGRLHFFENIPGPGLEAQFTLTEPNYKGIDVGQSAKPQLVDVDRDGLLDILAGERSGTIQYFRNIGSPGQPDFDPLPTLEKFGQVDVMPECCTGYAAPFMTQDSIGNSILYVGSEQGYLYLFTGIDGNLEGTFERIDSLKLHAVNVCASGEDINQDGRLEFIYGEFAGGLGLLKFGVPVNLGSREYAKNDGLTEIFPNPASEFLHVRLASGISNRRVEVSVFDSMGQETCVSAVFTGDKYSVDISRFPQGFYLLVLRIEGELFSSKFIKR